MGLEAVDGGGREMVRFTAKGRRDEGWCGGGSKMMGFNVSDGERKERDNGGVWGLIPNLENFIFLIEVFFNFNVCFVHIFVDLYFVDGLF